MSVEVTRLPSGLSVVTDRMPHLETASLGVWIGSGSRSEKPDEHGISHLLEHMAFKGTKRRSARQIAETIEAVGGDLNAATSVESTGYFARVLRADVLLALDVLSDILSEPTFDGDELRREQNVIVQEIGATEDAPDDLLFDRLQETAFPQQSIGRSILGTPETVRSFNPTRLRSYLARNYRAPDMVVAAGAVEHQAIVAEVDKRLAGFKALRLQSPKRRISAAAPEWKPATWSKCTLPWRYRDCPFATSNFTACRCSLRSGRRNVIASVPGGTREARTLLRDSRLPHALCGHRTVRSVCRNGRIRRSRAHARRHRPDWQRHRNAERHGNQSSQGADESWPIDGAGKPERASANWPARCSRMGAQFRSMKSLPRSTLSPSTAHAQLVVLSSAAQNLQLPHSGQAAALQAPLQSLKVCLRRAA